MQVWDRIDENLLERETSGRAEWSEILGLWWVVVEHPEYGHALRLSRDPVEQAVLPTRIERERAARATAERALEAAEARIGDLEAQIDKRKG